ncbi:MAG: ABC transporter substrate-binding protein [Alphaproteobacteria bacterium]|nr:ABC transporter substrate-binding protein [Alphaproteobacteria bacterium]
MIQFTRREFSLAALSTAALPLLGCGKKTSSNALKIGLLLPTSGHQSALGQECKKGADVAMQVLKDRMGVDFEIVFADTESNVKVGCTKAEKLISEGVHAIVGAYDSGVTSAIAQVCERHSIPLVINLAAAPPITEQGYKYVFRNFPTGPMLIRNSLNLMKDLFKEKGIFPKTAAFIHVNDTYGEAMRAGVGKIVEELNMPFKIVETIGYDPKTQDLSTEVGKIKASGAELIMPATRLDDAVLMIKEILKQQLNIMGVINPGSPGMYEKEFFHALGDKSNYWTSNTAWYNPKAPLTQHVLEAFKKKFPDDFLETSSAFTFEALHIVCDAYKRANSKEAAALRDAIATTNIEDHVCLGGPIQFDEKGQSKNLRSASMQNLNQRPTVVFPVEAREATPIFPIPMHTAA